MWAVECAPVHIKVEGGNYGEINISRLFLDIDETGVEVEGQAADEMCWKNIVLCRPVHPHWYLPGIMAHQGEGVF